MEFFCVENVIRCSQHHYNGGDRFILNRAGMNIEMSANSLLTVSYLEENYLYATSAKTDEGAISTARKKGLNICSKLWCARPG